MNKLVVHHRYRDGMAWDISDHFNHGTVQNALDAKPPYEGVAIEGAGSRVWVRPSSSLAGMLQVRATISFLFPELPSASPAVLLYPDGLPTLAVLPGGYLSVRNLGGGACDSTTPVISTATWHEARYEHDGINTCSLYLDGVAIAHQTAANRSIDSVGPAGVVVGNLSNPAAVAQTRIYVREVKIYRYEPFEMLKCLFDFQAVDRPGFERAVSEFFAEGHTIDGFKAQVDQVLALAGQRARDTRKSSIPETDYSRAIGHEFLTGVLEGDSSKVVQATQKATAQAATNVPAATTAQQHAALQGILAKMPSMFSDPKKVEALLRALKYKGSL